LPLACALLISILFALAGWRMRALSPAGTIAASVVGTTILRGTGVPGLLALGAFFVSASLISRIAPDRSAALDAKGSTRDPWQVLANGAAAAVGALVPGAGLWIVTASLAAAAADTWATSVGGWSRRPPRDVLTLRPVSAGASGGITLLGSVGAVFGAAVVGLGPALVSGSARLLAVALGIGCLGMLTDSLLGATIQGKFHCDACDQPTERPVHRCGRASRRTEGFAWLGNDGVNALATGAAALGGWLAWRCWGA
jgi:uncharacterized protein (TIGR00297 family)